MLNGHANHVKLQTPPLYRMICQMRFPQLLGFDNQAIRSIQKALAEDYPEAARSRVLMGLELGDEAKIASSFSELFRFIATDEDTEINLTDQFVSLQTKKYERFAHFASRWEQLVGILQKELGVTRQNRLGLRYTNVIQKEDKRNTEDWAGLVSDHLLKTEMAVRAQFDAIATSSQHQVRFQMSEGLFLFRYGSSPPADDIELPPGFLIDVDAYDDQPRSFEIQQQVSILATWNHVIFRFLRQSVTDELWSSFNPEG